MGKLRAGEGKAQADGTHLRGVGLMGSLRIRMNMLRFPIQKSQVLSL